MVLGILLLIVCGYINRMNCHFLIKSAISTKRRSYEFLGRWTNLISATDALLHIFLYQELPV